jgi:hypothetical protein
MESGLPGLECQAHGGTASKSWMRAENTVKNAQNLENQVQDACLLSCFGISPIFELSSPTGC